MEKLNQKAKTLSDLLWENRLEWDEWLRLGVTENKQIELAPKYQSMWIPLEDAEKLEGQLADFQSFLIEHQYDNLQFPEILVKWYEVFGEGGQKKGKAGRVFKLTSKGERAVEVGKQIITELESLEEEQKEVQNNDSLF